MYQCNWCGVVSDRMYCIPALSTQGTGPDVFVDFSAKEPKAFFIVVPWTCLLLIRASRLVDSKSPPRPWGRAQFVGILGSAVLLLLLLLLLSLLLLLLFCFSSYNYLFSIGKKR